MQMGITQGKKYRRWLFAALGINLLLMAGVYLWEIESRVPGHIILYQNQEEKLDLDVPLVGEIASAVQKVIHIKEDQGDGEARSVSFSLDQPVTLQAENTGSYQADLKLFGVIPYKKLQFDVIQEAKVTPAGETVGIYIESDGIMVLGTTEIEGEDGFVYHPAAEILQAGDYLTAVNDTKVENIQQVAALIQKNGDKKLTLQLLRGNNEIKVRVDPVCTQDGKFQIGVWLREDTEGIGTMTCVLEDGRFAALGHGITDVDTGMLINLQKGGLFPATVEEVIRGKKGTPGELTGTVALEEEEKIGDITENTSWGIAGTVFDRDYGYQEEKSMRIGLKQEIREGKASILCQLGDGVKEYEIEIEKIYLTAKDQKGMVLHVTDQELLAKTGGIVQGMSGSPIIQNGKLVGAVTHVFVNDPTRGYGIFAETMLAQP